MNGRWCPVKGDTEDGRTASYKKSVVIKFRFMYPINTNIIFKKTLINSTQKAVQGSKEKKNVNRKI